MLLLRCDPRYTTTAAWGIQSCHRWICVPKYYHAGYMLIFLFRAARSHRQSPRFLHTNMRICNETIACLLITGDMSSVFLPHMVIQWDSYTASPHAAANSHHVCWLLHFRYISIAHNQGCMYVFCARFAPQIRKNLTKRADSSLFVIILFLLVLLVKYVVHFRCVIKSRNC